MRERRALPTRQTDAEEAKGRQRLACEQERAKIKLPRQQQNDDDARLQLSRKLCVRDKEWRWWFVRAGLLVVSSKGWHVHNLWALRSAT